MGTGMARVFSAIDIPESVRLELARVQEELDAGFNRVAPEQFHVTLEFFEDISQDDIERVSEALAQVAVEPFTATVQGLGAFPSLDYISVVWAGMEADEVYTLQEQAADHGVESDDTHDFHPHVTLLRVDSIAPAEKQRLQERIRAGEGERFGTFTVDHVTLYASTLGPDGPVYEDLARHEL